MRRPTPAPPDLRLLDREPARVHTDFVNAGGFNDQAVEVDFAFARVGLGGKGATGTLDLDAVTGGYGLKTSGVTTTKLWAFGYPAAGKYKGKDLTYCTGTLATIRTARTPGAWPAT